MRRANRAALATRCADDGHPYASLVSVATDVDGSPILLLSQLADHTRNLAADPRLSLLFDGTDGYANPQEGPRVTLLGRITPASEPRIAARFLARHPSATLYAGFADFAFYRMNAERAHWVGGFARAVWLDGRLVCDQPLAAAFASVEADLLARLNGTQAEALDLLGRRAFDRQGPWRLVAVDPDGVDLACSDAVMRVDFNKPVASPEDVSSQWSILTECATRTP